VKTQQYYITEMNYSFIYMQVLLKYKHNVCKKRVCTQYRQSFKC